jgi:hypothetical protein
VIRFVLGLRYQEVNRVVHWLAWDKDGVNMDGWMDMETDTRAHLGGY